MTSSRSQSSKFGRPVKSIVHKDLVIIPNPSTNQVPSHAFKVKLEDRGLIIHEFPFDRRWTPLGLKRNIESQLPISDVSSLEVANCFKRLSRYSTGGRDFVHALVTASRICCEPRANKTIEFMFASINMFWARLRLILARAVRRGLK